MPINPIEAAKVGLAHLQAARACFKAADNRNTVERIRAAISSARGAVRIQEMRGPAGGKHGERKGYAS